MYVFVIFFTFYLFEYIILLYTVYIDEYNKFSNKFYLDSK